ncbi:hypothetical protein Q7A53_20585 [Halobacillus rhizosphaerae]|uniref:hypothetical protein n=1 Tax=Halobacillus rhizosphaerae TaxID=3064889 RepID=UPI00398B5CAE
MNNQKSSLLLGLTSGFITGYVCRSIYRSASYYRNRWQRKRVKLYHAGKMQHEQIQRAKASLQSEAKKQA